MWTLEDFVQESNRIEGILRDPTEDEIVAHRLLMALDKITVPDLEIFVAVVHPARECASSRKRRFGISIGCRAEKVRELASVGNFQTTYKGKWRA